MEQQKQHEKKNNLTKVEAQRISKTKKGGKKKEKERAIQKKKKNI